MWILRRGGGCPHMFSRLRSKTEDDPVNPFGELWILTARARVICSSASVESVGSRGA